MTAILNSKQQRNATVYQDLKAEMSQTVFQKSWQSFTLKITQKKTTTLKESCVCNGKRNLCSGDSSMTASAVLPTEVSLPKCGTSTAMLFGMT